MTPHDVDILNIILAAIGSARQDGLLVATGAWGVCTGDDGFWHATESIMERYLLPSGDGPRVANVYASCGSIDVEVSPVSPEKLAEHAADIEASGAFAGQTSPSRTGAPLVATTAHPLCPLGAVLRGLQVDSAVPAAAFRWTLRPFVQRALAVTEAWVYGFLAALDDPNRVSKHEQAWADGMARSWESEGRRIRRGSDERRIALAEVMAGAIVAESTARLAAIVTSTAIEDIR